MFPISEIIFVTSSILFLIVLAIGFHQLVFFTTSRLIKKESVADAIVRGIKKPTFYLFLALVFLIGIDLATLPQVAAYHLHHLAVVIIIIMIGLVLIFGAHGIYRYLLEKYKTESIEDISRRSLLTQTQILYRVFLFLIIVLTISCVLITFPGIRSLGIGLLGSAGVAGIALGIAARPILQNMLSGIQIALTKILKIGDIISVEGDTATVEHLFLTHAVLKTWDHRRIYLPISYFIDKPFQNWSGTPDQFIGWALIYCDYSISVDALREKFFELLHNSSYWDRRHWNVEVTDATEKTIEVRLSMSARTVGDALTLRTHIREKMIGFIQEKYPQALPLLRIEGKKNIY